MTKELKIQMAKELVYVMELKTQAMRVFSETLEQKDEEEAKKWLKEAKVFSSGEINTIMSKIV